MKKILTTLFVCMVYTIITIGNVKAATQDTIANELYAKLSEYGMTMSDKVQVERYVKKYPDRVTPEKANSILAKADEAVALMDSRNVKDVRKLNEEDRQKIREITIAAGKIADVTVVFTGKDKAARFYAPDGTLFTVLYWNENGKLVYTGNNTILVVSSVAVIALAAAVGTKKYISKKA